MFVEDKPQFPLVYVYSGVNDICANDKKTYGQRTTSLKSYNTSMTLQLNTCKIFEKSINYPTYIVCSEGVKCSHEPWRLYPGLEI